MKILITSGGTTEKIDAVRGITNHSTGTLGKYIAELFLNNGHEVSLVTTKSAVKPAENPNLKVYIVDNVATLMDTLKPLVKTHQVLIHSMAVSDYTFVYMTDLCEVEKSDNIAQLLTKKNTENKISSKSDYQVLFLKKTPKLISLVKDWNPLIQLIGFKLLVGVTKEELLNVARESLQKNKASYILANDLTEITPNQHHAFLLSEQSVEEVWTKEAIAKLLYKKVTTDD